MIMGFNQQYFWSETGWEKFNEYRYLYVMNEIWYKIQKENNEMHMYPVTCLVYTYIITTFFFLTLGQMQYLRIDSTVITKFLLVEYS